MRERNFERCEEARAFYTMKERIYTMIDESGIHKNPQIAQILDALGVNEDAGDILADYITERADLIQRVWNDKQIHALEAQIYEIYRTLEIEPHLL